MLAAPRTQYARNGDVNLAFQVVGDGPVDLVFIPGWFSHLDLFWELPASNRFFSGLARFSRLIMYDKRGTGLSDPVSHIGSYADRVDDLRAVMEAAGTERPVICALSEGGPVAAHFAAAQPDRLQSLILLNSPISAADVPGMRAWRATIQDGWGQGALFTKFLPELPDTEEMRVDWARTQRLSAGRGLALQYFDQLLELDAGPALGAIAASTLVLRGTLDQVVAPDTAARLAAAIPGARVEDVPCGHIPWVVGGREVVSAIERFATGATPRHRTDRRVATVLFTDIVDSTRWASDLGDRAWRALLERHDDIVRDAIRRSAGREVKSTGDGFLAVFDGPGEAIDCAQEVRAGASGLGIETRAGVHMGQCEFRDDDDVAGIAVHIGARVAALAEPGEILVSRTVRDLVIGSDIGLTDRGEHELKGVSDPWRVFAVT